MTFFGQPDNHIGWATSLGYSWVCFTYSRTISWNFGEKVFRIGGFEKLTFFETTKFLYSRFKKNKVFLALFLLKYLINSWVPWIGFNIYDYSNFQQKPRVFAMTLHVCQNFVVSKKVNFSNPPILNIFSPKFQEMILG